MKIAGQGCSISQASTSMMSAAVKGKSLDEARQLIRAFKALMSIHESKLEGEADGSDLAADLEGVRLGDLEALQGVVKFPVRIKCATLAWNTLQQALDEAAPNAGVTRRVGDRPREWRRSHAVERFAGYPGTVTASTGRCTDSGDGRLR